MNFEMFRKKIQEILGQLGKMVQVNAVTFSSDLMYVTLSIYLLCHDTKFETSIFN